MVVEGPNGEVSYMKPDGKVVEGPAEANTGRDGPTVWVTLVDPVSGQVYYYSRLSGDSRWVGSRRGVFSRRAVPS